MPTGTFISTVAEADLLRQRTCACCGQGYSVAEYQATALSYFHDAHRYEDGCWTHCLGCWLGIEPEPAPDDDNFEGNLLRDCGTWLRPGTHLAVMPLARVTLDIPIRFSGGMFMYPDEERRQDSLRWGSLHFVPKYAAGVERRRLLIVNALFVAAAELGCRAFMHTSKYEQSASGRRLLSITAGQSEIRFSIEPMQSTKSGRESLRLELGLDPADPGRSWEDGDAGKLERQLPDVLVAILVRAETAYRGSLIQCRERIIEAKAWAAEELSRRQREAERQAREREVRLQQERIDRLLAHAGALDRANQIRAYVESVLSRGSELALPPREVSRWASWARGEADRIDPCKNGTTTQAIRECLVGVESAS